MTACRLKESERATLLLGNPALEIPETSIKAHLAECSSCAEAFALQTVVWKAMDAWEMPVIGSNFNRELYAKIDAAAAAPWYKRWAAELQPALSRPYFALGVAVAVICTGFILDHPAANVTPIQTSRVSPLQHSIARSAVQVSNSEAEQVEKTLEDMEMLRQFDLGAEEKASVSKSM